MRTGDLNTERHNQEVWCSLTVVLHQLIGSFFSPHHFFPDKLCVLFLLYWFLANIELLNALKWHVNPHVTCWTENWWWWWPIYGLLLFLTTFGWRGQVVAYLGYACAVIPLHMWDKSESTMCQNELHLDHVYFMIWNNAKHFQHMNWPHDSWYFLKSAAPGLWYRILSLLTNLPVSL